MSNLSAAGALTAFGSGIMLGFGWALLNNDRFQDAKDVARTTVGGGFSSLVCTCGRRRGLGACGWNDAPALDLAAAGAGLTRG